MYFLSCSASFFTFFFIIITRSVAILLSNKLQKVILLDGDNKVSAVSFPTDRCKVIISLSPTVFRSFIVIVPGNATRYFPVAPDYASVCVLLCFFLLPYLPTLTLLNN